MFLKYFKFVFFIFFLLLTENIFANSRCEECQKSYSYLFVNDTSCEAVDKFLSELVEAVKSDDPDKISKFIKYPCNLSGKPVIKNKSQFKKLYNKIFTDFIKNIIINGSVTEVGYHGFMINRGVIWFIPEEGIIAINLPH